MAFAELPSGVVRKKLENISVLSKAPFNYEKYETIVTTIRIFLDEYYKELSSNATINLAPGSVDENDEIEQLRENLENLRNWLITIITHTKDFPKEIWASNLDVLVSLKKAQCFIDARAGTGTYLEVRLKLKDNDAKIIKKLRTVLEELRDELEELAAAIFDAKNSIDDIPKFLIK